MLWMRRLDLDGRGSNAAARARSSQGTHSSQPPSAWQQATAQHPARGHLPQQNHEQNHSGEKLCIQQTTARELNRKAARDPTAPRLHARARLPGSRGDMANGHWQADSFTRTHTTGDCRCW